MYRLTKRNGKPASLSVCTLLPSTKQHRKWEKNSSKTSFQKKRWWLFLFGLPSIVNFNLAGFRAGPLRHRDRNQLEPTCFGFPLSFFSFGVGRFTWIRCFSILKCLLWLASCGYWCIVSSNAFSKPWCYARWCDDAAWQNLNKRDRDVRLCPFFTEHKRSWTKQKLIFSQHRRLLKKLIYRQRRKRNFKPRTSKFHWSHKTLSIK